ncbi:MAG: threonine/serine exporter family protein, partial [Eubacterium sp.]|nr:threonine/serine exporter family protein [Eubacterium sp.]
AISVCAATSAFCIFFKGTLIDAVFSAIIGLVITYAPYKKISFPLFSANLIDAFIAGILAHLPFIFGLEVQPDKIIVGTIMLLVPGLTVVNAMRDMMNGDLVAGMFELFNAIMSALGIALGTAGAILIFTKL